MYSFFVHVPWHDESGYGVLAVLPFCPVLFVLSSSCAIAESFLSVLSRFQPFPVLSFKGYRLRKCFDTFCRNIICMLASMTLVAKSKLSGALSEAILALETTR